MQSNLTQIASLKFSLNKNLSILNRILEDFFLPSSIILYKKRFSFKLWYWILNYGQLYWTIFNFVNCHQSIFILYKNSLVWIKIVSDELIFYRPESNGALLNWKTFWKIWDSTEKRWGEKPQKYTYIGSNR